MPNQIKQEFSPPLAKENVKNVPNKEDLHNKQADYPKWMRVTTCRRFPYFPQLGDLVVYFQQGHEAYLGELKKTGIPVSPRFKINPNLDAEEVCFVDAVDFETIGESPEEIHVARLQLSRTENGKRTGQSFQICYHDMPNVLDFIVLKQHFDESMAMQLKPGDGVELIFDDKFYTGRVINRNPYQPEKYPNSAWRSVCLEWEDGAKDKRSPWDLQKRARGRKYDMPATVENQANLGKYTATLERAESAAESASQLHQDRLLFAINQLSQLEDIGPFREAVDLRLHEDYLDCFAYPIDLHTIKERILNGFYRRNISILHDIQFLAKNANACAYDGSITGAHMIKSSRLLVEALFRNWDEKDAIALYNRLKSYNGPLPLDCWKMKIQPAENAVDSVPLPAGPAEQSTSLQKILGTRDSDKELTGQTNATIPLWIPECREMVEQLKRTFNGYRRYSSQDMSNLGSTFLNDFHAEYAKLLVQCERPDKFLEGLCQFISKQKSNLLKTKTRGSKIYQAIHAMESQLESKQQSILANYRRKLLEEQLEEDNEAQPNRRRKRASALAAQTHWRNAEPESSSSTATQNTEMVPYKYSNNKLKRKLDETEQPGLHAPPKRKLEEPKVREGTTIITVEYVRRENAKEPGSSTVTATESTKTVRKAELDELRACKRRLEEIEPEFQANKRRLDEAELKLQHYETLKPFVDAGMQFRLEKPKDGNIALALPNFAELSAQGKAFKAQSDPIDLAGFRWNLCAFRPANDAWMGILLKPNSPENYKGRFQLEVDCFFRISNKRSFSKEIRKEMGAMVSNEIGGVAIPKFARIEDLRDPNMWFLQADGSVQLKVEFIVKSAQLDPCYEEVGDEDVQNGDETGH